MKKLVMIMSIAVLMASCKNKTNADDTKVLGTSAEEAAKAKAPAPTVIVKERTVVEHVPVQTATATPSTVKKKKGLSKTTKGALIGTAAGAAAGALIDKNNRGVGALIGGAIGSGAGYGIGAAQDKKDKKAGQ